MKRMLFRRAMRHSIGLGVLLLGMPGLHAQQLPPNYGTPVHVHLFFSITQATCQITVDPKPVSLDALSSSIANLPMGAVDWGKAKPVTLKLDGCGSSISSATFSFKANAAPGNLNYFEQTGTAQGIAIALSATQDDSGLIHANGDQKSSKTVAVSGGKAGLPLWVAMAHVGNVQPGDIVGAIEFSMTYE